MSKRRELSDEDVRRLVPIAIDLIRDDLNPADLQRGAMFDALKSEDPLALMAVQAFVGRWFARSLAQCANERDERDARIFRLENGDEYEFVPDPHTPESIIAGLEEAILAQRRGESGTGFETS